MLGSSADLERVWSGEAASVVKERAAAVCFFFFYPGGERGCEGGRRHRCAVMDGDELHSAQA